MRLGKFTKTPVDRKRYSIDYSDWLDDTEVIQSVTFEVTPTTASPLVVDGDQINPDGKGVTFYVSGGLDGTTYKVLPTMTSAGGQIRKDSIQYTAAAP
ncbi:MAG: hypothetical protein E6R03_00690 [Hyphomicrobiaceae bacterium]|nr:MAG: hypothetical protein E6R03_00690 [Hyphomicrobiaceae bacterium]